VDPCDYCTDNGYSDEFLCIVEEPFNIISIEKTGIYKGKYHVLLGVLSPLKGIGPDELKLDRLIDRIKNGNFKEIIIATNPTVEGEATAHYIVKILKDFQVKLTRLAMGLPVGSDIDFADQVTIKKSLEGRTEIKEIDPRQKIMNPLKVIQRPRMWLMLLAMLQPSIQSPLLHLWESLQMPGQPRKERISLAKLSK
jgi:hypothetical protein